MIIEDLLNLGFNDIINNYKDNIVNTGYVNNIIELKGIKSKYNTNENNAILFFDLVDKSQITMVVIKVENVSFINSILLNLNSNNKCKEYIISITKTGNKEYTLTYVKEKIIKAL
jgi:hypothetical protein